MEEYINQLYQKRNSNTAQTLLPVVNMDTNRQRGGDDCGVFMLQYAAQISSDQTDYPTADNIIEIRHRLFQEITRTTSR